MLSKHQIKTIGLLKQKKHREQLGLFVAEGIKTITELIHSDIELFELYTTRSLNFNAKNEILISNSELLRISFQKTPNTALAVFKMPKPKPIVMQDFVLVLDDVRDPGNLGTIIRLCDWFGIQQLVCSLETTDCYNPKVVQATMGSLARVNINYTNLESFLKTAKVPIYGAFMEGHSIYTQNMPTQGILVLGNEANGISQKVETYIQEKVSIPRFGALKVTESLNVATATAILLGEIKRQQL